MHPTAPERVMQAEGTGATSRHTTYAEWFAWAKRHVDDGRRCHAAAHAATSALEGRMTIAQVAPIAQRAAEAPDAATAPIRADNFTQSYAGWYAWASIDNNLDPAASHRAAIAATQAQLNRANPTQAAAAALKAVGATVPILLTDAKRYPPVYSDIGLYEIGWGLACLIVPFVLSITILPIGPLLGLVIGIRAFIQGRSRPWLAIPGFILNLIALVFTTLLFFGGHHR